MAFDLVVRNGTVVDGTGLPPYRADVGVVGDRIVRIGRITERGVTEIDAEGHIVTPGFIDGHTHMDAQVFWDQLGTSSCWHGVTSVVMGNCGFTLAPATPAGRDLVVRNIQRAEDISAEAMAAGIDWTWESFAEYLDAVEARPKGINYAGYVGHSALRTWVMGERAFTEEASEDDLAAMERGLIEALHAGAVGFSTSRSINHQTPDDQPVASRLAAWSEFERLVLAMGAAGGGLVELAAENAMDDDDPAVRAESNGRLIDLAVRSGCTLMFGIGIEKYRERFEIIDQAAAAGGRILAQTTTRMATAILSFKTQLPFDKLPQWSQVRALPLDEQRRAYLDPDVRARLVAEAATATYGAAIGAEAPPPEYELMLVLEGGLPPHRTVGEVAAATGVHPVEAMIDLGLASDFDQLFAQRLTGAAWRDEDLLAIMRHPRAVVALSDQGAHVTQLCDASLPTHLLAYWVRDREVIALAEAVRMLTLIPAVSFGLADRGLLRPGMIADLNVIDLVNLAPEVPVLVHDLPAGARRLVQKAQGIRATVVAGEIVFRDGEHTGAFPGRVIRGPLAVGALA